MPSVFAILDEGAVGACTVMQHAVLVSILDYEWVAALSACRWPKRAGQGYWRWVVWSIVGARICSLYYRLQPGRIA